MEDARSKARGATWAVGALAATLAAVPVVGAATTDEVGPLRLTARAFDRSTVLEVRDLPESEASTILREAFRRLQEMESLLAGAQERLNAGATTERAVGIEAPVLDLLSRAMEYCHWSEGAVGPLGGALAEHWAAVAGNPSPPPVPQALLATADCERLALDTEDRVARLAAGSRVTLEGFAAGFAVDRAVDALRELGADNGMVRIGRIHRAFGEGPPASAGQGWPVLLPTFEGYERAFDAVRLRDLSLAVEWRADWPADRPRHVDQRTGSRPDGVWAAAAVTELALDAQALAVAGVVMGVREGRFRMSALKPEPSILWLMGSGKGRPLRSDLNWSDLRTP